MKIGKIFDNFEIKLICLLLAIVMWFYANKPQGTEAIDRVIAAISRSDQGKITFRELPIKPMGLRKNWKADPEKISLEVKCLVAEVETSNFRVIINLATKNEEERRVILTEDNVILPKGLVFVKAEPKEIRLVPIL